MGMSMLAKWKLRFARRPRSFRLCGRTTRPACCFQSKESLKFVIEKACFFIPTQFRRSGKSRIRLRDTAVNFLSLSSHKFHGPKGVGALYVNRRIRFTPLVAGGGQENGRRGGTENAAGIVGLGKAAELAGKHLIEGKCSVRSMRDRFEKALLETVNNALVNGAGAER